MAERHYHGFGVLTKVVLIILRKVLQGLPETCRTALKELNMNNPRCEPGVMRTSHDASPEGAEEKCILFY